MADAPKKGRLTLYEDLLSEETLAERKAKEAQAVAEGVKKKKDASLMFKPTNLGKKSNYTAKPANKPKATFASMHKLSSSTSTTTSTPPTVAASSPQPQPLTSDPPPQKRGFSDWLANEDEEWMYDGKPKNAGRNKKKKKNKQVQEEWSWEDIYDPHVPVNFLEYPKSEVQYDINEAWKQRLYDARKREKQRQERDAKRDQQQFSTKSNPFVPLGNMSFAPPSDLNHQPQQLSNPLYQEPSNPLYQDFTHPARTPDDPYAARMSMTQTSFSNDSSTPPLPGLGLPNPVSASPIPTNSDAAEKAAKVAAQIAKFKATAQARALTAKAGGSASPSVVQQTNTPPAADAHIPPPPPPPDEPLPNISLPGVIAAAPTFNPEYAAWKARQEAGEDLEDATAPVDDPDAPRSNRPGQAGFAERMLKKMGWEGQGSGLGARGEGITTAIVAKADKRKKRADAQGGGFATPANMGKIVGGKKAKSAAPEDANDTFGPMSEVIKLENILANMDVDKEIQENNILQEIGDEVGEFGKVERLFIWRDHVGGHNEVFVKFTSELSALRAVRDMDGIEFADNIVKARFWDAEKFERGEYE